MAGDCQCPTAGDSTHWFPVAGDCQYLMPHDRMCLCPYCRCQCPMTGGCRCQCPFEGDCRCDSEELWLDC